MGSAVEGLSDDDFLRGIEMLYKLPRGSVESTTKLEDLKDWDSIGKIEFLAFADETYGVAVPGEQLRNCSLVGDLKMLVLGAR